MGNGVLKGQSYDDIVQLLVEHMQEEASIKEKEMQAKYGIGFQVPPEKELNEWIRTILDPNLDEAITIDKAIHGFKKVVDEIETGEEYSAKRRTSECQFEG